MEDFPTRDSFALRLAGCPCIAPAIVQELNLVGDMRVVSATEATQVNPDSTLLVAVE